MSFHILRSSNIESACLVILLHLYLLQKFSAIIYQEKNFLDSVYCLDIQKYLSLEKKINKFIIYPDSDDIYKRYIHYNIKPVSLKTSRTTTDNQTSIANFLFSNYHNSHFKLLLHVSAYIHFINTNIKILPFQPFCLLFLRHLQPLSMPSPLLLDFSETCQTEA